MTPLRDCSPLPPTRGHWHVCRCGARSECPMPPAEADQCCRVPEPYVCAYCTQFPLTKEPTRERPIQRPRPA